MPFGISSFSFASLQRNFSSLGTGLAESVRRLSTGSRVNSAKDDAAGLAISTRMQAQVRGNTQAIRNVNDMVSYMQVGEASMSKIADSLLKIRDVAVQSANGDLSVNDRGQLQKEVDQLTQEISRIIDGAQFNGMNVLKNENAMDIQISADGSAKMKVSGMSLAGGATSKTTTEEVTDTFQVPVDPVPASAAAIAQAAAATAYMNTMLNYKKSSAQTFMTQAVNRSGMTVVSGRVRKTGSNVVFNPQTPQNTAVNNIFQAIQSTYNANIGSKNATTLMISAAQAVTNAYIAAAQPTPGGFTTVTTTRTVSTTQTTGNPGLKGYDANGAAAGLFDVSSNANAAESLAYIDSDIDKLNEMRASFGAYQVRLESIGNSLMESVSNLNSSNSRISDTDYAVEFAQMSKFSMISQSAMAMMAHANISSKMVLNLLGNNSSQNGLFVGGVAR
ncbi:MAG: hypothetical protein RIR18_1184 [Pseudomonadota bacterium]|jgi:flagellin